MRIVRLILLLCVASAIGCESLSSLMSVSGLFRKKPAPTPFSESADAWDGTWAEQKDR